MTPVSMQSKQSGNPLTKNELPIHHSRLLNDSDKRRLGDLYVKYQKNILAYIVSLGIKRAIAEDLTHNVFLQICCDYVSGRKIINFQGYLFGVARYLVFEYRRAANRLPVILLSKDLENIVTKFPEGRSAAVQKSDEAVESISLKALDKIVANLPEKYREAFELRYIQNLPLHIAAKRAGCSQNTLCQRVCRAIKTVRIRLKLSPINHL